jgi:hypothetical protein
VCGRGSTAHGVVDDEHPRTEESVSGTCLTAHLPIDHLFAELAAFPLASEAARQNPITHLDPAMSTATVRLWCAAKQELLASASEFSLDDLVARVTAAGFPSTTNDRAHCRRSSA